MLCSTSKSTARLLPKKQEQVFPNKAGSHFPTGCNKCDVIFFWTTERLKHSPQSRARSEPPNTHTTARFHHQKRLVRSVDRTHRLRPHLMPYSRPRNKRLQRRPRVLTARPDHAQTTYMQSLRTATRSQRVARPSKFLRRPPPRRRCS
jgi:hypothetical protein